MKIFVYGENAQLLKLHLIEAGHELLQDIELVEIAICWNWGPQFRKVLRRIKLQGLPNILIVTEPSVVTPEHSKPSFLGSFNKVISVGRPGSKFIYPVRWDLNYFDAIDRQCRVVAISANKTSWVPGEQYSLRRKIYAHLKQIDVYGPGWDMSLGSKVLMALKDAAIALRGGSRISMETLTSLTARPANLLGPVPNKLETLSHYKVSVVVENSSEYMSEKLLEAMLAGTIPVYVGPDPIEYGVPSSLVITAGNTAGEVAEACRVALATDYESWAREAKDWLLNPRTREIWSSERLNEKVLEAVCAPIERGQD